MRKKIPLPLVVQGRKLQQLRHQKVVRRGLDVRVAQARGLVHDAPRRARAGGDLAVRRRHRREAPVRPVDRECVVRVTAHDRQDGVCRRGGPGLMAIGTVDASY